MFVSPRILDWLRPEPIWVTNTFLDAPLPPTLWVFYQWFFKWTFIDKHISKIFGLVFSVFLSGPHSGHTRGSRCFAGVSALQRSFSVVPPKVQLADACAIFFVEVAHTIQHSNVTLLRAHSRGQLHSLFVLVLRWARKRVSSHMGKIETMDVLPTMAFTRNGITQACNTILNLSSVDGTRNGSPEFVLIPYAFKNEGITRSVYNSWLKTSFRYSGDTSKCDCAVFPYLNQNGHSQGTSGNQNGFFVSRFLWFPTSKMFQTQSLPVQPPSNFYWIHDTWCASVLLIHAF